MGHGGLLPVVPRRRLRAPGPHRRWHPSREGLPRGKGSDGRTEWVPLSPAQSAALLRDRHLAHLHHPAALLGMVTAETLYPGNTPARLDPEFVKAVEENMAADHLLWDCRCRGTSRWPAPDTTTSRTCWNPSRSRQQRPRRRPTIGWSRQRRPSAVVGDRRSPSAMSRLRSGWLSKAVAVTGAHPLFAHRARALQVAGLAPMVVTGGGNRSRTFGRLPRSCRARSLPSPSGSGRPAPQEPHPHPPRRLDT